MTTPATAGYVCDTLPTPRFAGSRSPTPVPPSAPDSAPAPDNVPIVDPATLKVVEHGGDPVLLTDEPDLSFAPPGRKLCVRHQRMADEGTNLKLQHVCRLLVSGYQH
jgi:F-box/WD-40 domain protein MET30